MTKEILPTLLSSFHEALLHKLHIGRATSTHPVTKGDLSEFAWLEMLGDYLPTRYKATGGFVVDSNGGISDQIDLIIYDRQYSPFIFQMDGTRYVPAESVYAAFEVKQSLNLKNVKYAQDKIASVRNLHRTSLPVPTANGTANAVTPKPILGGLVCYQSEWTPPFGDSFYEAIKDKAPEEIIDIVCVAQNGVYELSQDGHTVKDTDKAVTYFFFRLVSLLQKKATVPMIDVMAYAAWLEKLPPYETKT